MLSSFDKAAVLLTQIGDDNLQNILPLLKKEHVKRLIEALKNVENIPVTVRREILRDALNKDTGGEKKEAQMKSSTFMDLMNDEEEEEEIDVISFLERAEHKQLLELIKSEHPQVMAFILSYIPHYLSSQVLAQLPDDIQTDVAFRIATMEIPQKDMIRHLNIMLGNKIKMLTRKTKDVGGVGSLVKILKGAGRNSERIILEHFRKEKPELATEIKDMMLVFEDLVFIDDIYIQKILRDIDTKILAKALKKTTQDIKDLIMKNLSERARAILSEEMSSLGPMPVKEVERAQQQIIEVVRQLEEKGELNINKENQEYV